MVGFKYKKGVDRHLEISAQSNSGLKNPAQLLGGTRHHMWGRGGQSGGLPAQTILILAGYWL